jgi:hypothetical protein
MMRSAKPSAIAVENRIVFGAARQNLNRAADFFVATNDGVELAVARGLGQVARIFFERLIGIFGTGIVGRTAFAQVIDGRVQCLRRQAGFGKRLACVDILFGGKCQQNAFDRDV